MWSGHPAGAAMFAAKLAQLGFLGALSLHGISDSSSFLNSFVPLLLKFLCTIPKVLVQF